MKNLQILMMGRKNVFVEFITNKNGTFNPTISTNIYTAMWYVEGETPQNTNAPSFSLDGTDRVVKLMISDFSDINTFDISSQNIKGALDLTLLTNAVEIKFNTNSLVTSIINPISSAIITNYLTHATAITSSDLSKFSNLGGGVTGYDNASLTSLTTGSSSQNINNFLFFNTNISGSLDASGYTNMGGDIRVYNTGITDFIFPITSRNFTIIYIYSTSIGVLNWENLSGTINNIQIQNCAFTAAESDENLVKIAALGLSNLTVVINGTNAAITDGSVTGFDGLQAKIDIEALGGSVSNN